MISLSNVARKPHGLHVLSLETLFVQLKHNLCNCNDKNDDDGKDNDDNS